MIETCVRIGGIMALLAGAPAVAVAALSDARPAYLPPDQAHGPWAAWEYAGETTHADFLLRVGDIDNFGAGWTLAYRPFGGDLPRAFGQTRRVPDDPEGTDGAAWERTASGGHQLVVESAFLYLGEVESARLQLFAGRVAPGDIRVTARLGGIKAPFIEEALNGAEIPAGKGRLLSFPVPEAYLKTLGLGQFALVLETAGAPPPLALDFVSVFVNPAAAAAPEPARVDGLIVDRRDGVPLRGVKATGHGRSAVTDGRGHFSLAGLHPGHTVVVLEGGGERTAHALDLRAGETKRITLPF